jgi:arginine/ornithine N-succinyltransferase beta subunit
MRTRIRKVTESIKARVNYLTDTSFADEDDLGIPPVDYEDVTRLSQLAGQVAGALAPVPPRPAFQARLKESLLAASSQRLAAERESRVSALRRRWVLIGAAAGSVMSVAGIVAAVLLHQRTIRL